MAFSSRTYLTALFVGALAAGCGHLGFVELPLDAEGGGPLDDAGGLEAGDGQDAASVDSGVDAGCAGPSCPGTYVSGATGKDTNPGTSALPVQTITKGIEIAVSLGGDQNVYVAGGHYPEKVTLADRVDLLGGYDCNASSCTWARDFVKNDTAILDTDFEGVLAPAAVTRKTLLEGFRIVGKGGAPTAAPGSVAVTLKGGTPTIRRCFISGADTTGGIVEGRQSIGVAVLAPSNAEGALLEKNAISSGAATDSSIGVLFDKSVTAVTPESALAVLTGNTIRSGAALFTSAVVARASGAGTRLVGNDITAGTSTGTVVAADAGTVTTTSSSSWGITVGSEMTIDANRINVDEPNVGTCTSDTVFCGGIQSLSSTTVITNNVVRGVKGPRTCAVLLAEGDPPAGVVVLNANTLDGAGGGPVNGNSTSISTAIALRAGVGPHVVIGSVRNNILLGGANHFRYGVYEEDESSGKTAHTSALDNNDFWFPSTPGPGMPYRLWKGDAGQDIVFASLGTLTPTPSGNINADPLLDGTYHLNAGSPCIGAGTSTEAPPRDIDGDPRPNSGGFDIGADETK